jgi:hypothetical protein
VPAPTHDELCYNHYYVDVTLDTAWNTYTLEFYFTTNMHFEVWVDDLKFTTN